VPASLVSLKLPLHAFLRHSCSSSNPLTGAHNQHMQVPISGIRHPVFSNDVMTREKTSRVPERWEGVGGLIMYVLDICAVFGEPR
jgi:hypothetical protein